MVTGGGTLAGPMVTTPIWAPKSFDNHPVWVKNHCFSLLKRTFVVSMTFYGLSNAIFISKLQIDAHVTRSICPCFAFRRFQCIQGRAGVFNMNHARLCFLLPDRLCDSQLLQFSILSCWYRLQLTFWWQFLLDRHPFWTTSHLCAEVMPWHCRDNYILLWQKTNKQSHGVLTMLRRVGGYESASAF